MFLRNDVDSGEAMIYSRGEGSAGPLATSLVVWSPCTTRQAPIIQADNVYAAALMAGGWYPAKSAQNAGCCTVFVTGVQDVTNIEEFSWRI